MRGEFIDVGEAQLYYYASGTRGAGDPLLLVHGFPTSSYLWAPLVPLAPLGHRVLVPDLLGFGRSDPDAGSGQPARRPLDLSIAGHARRLAGLLDALHVDRLCAVGHGTSASVVLALAAAQPGRITRLGLVNPITPDAWPTVEAGVLRLAMPVVRALPTSVILRAIRRRLMPRHQGSVTYEHATDQFLRAFAGRSGRATLLQQLRLLSTSPAPQSLDSVRALPTAIVWGDHDHIVPRSAAHRLQQGFPESTLDFVSGGHFSPTESPEQVAKVLRQLLERPSRSGH